MNREEQSIIKSFIRGQIHGAEDAVRDAELALVTAQAQLAYAKSLLKAPTVKTTALPPGKPGPAADIKPRRSVGKAKRRGTRKTTSTQVQVKGDLIHALQSTATKTGRSSTELLASMRAAKGGLERYPLSQKYIDSKIADALKRLRGEKITNLVVEMNGQSYRYKWKR